jgi:hypothetical protein
VTEAPTSSLPRCFGRTPGTRKGPSDEGPFLCFASRALPFPWGSGPVDEAGAREVGELVWILPVTRRADGAVGPRPARDDLTASHLEGLMRIWQLDHLLPLVRGMVPQTERYGNDLRAPAQGNRSRAAP